MDGAEVWAGAGGGLSVPARGLGTSVSCREGTARDQSLSLSCARFLTELVSSAASMPGAALAAAVVAASGRVSCVPWRRAGILLGRGRM